MANSSPSSMSEKEAQPTIIQTSKSTQHSDRSSTQSSYFDIKVAAAENTSHLQSVLREKDPNIVDWDGEDDPEKPLNWPSRKKWTYIILLSALTLLT